MLLESKKNDLATLRGKIDEKHDLLLNDIDEQIRYYRQELERIQEELKSEKNPNKKMFKGWKKGKIEKKSADLD